MAAIDEINGRETDTDEERYTRNRFRELLKQDEPLTVPQLVWARRVAKGGV
jgi:hypothetical protein